MDELQRTRESYASEVRQLASVRSDALVRAFATVHREHYLGDGPWRVLSIPGGYQTTESADPAQLYLNVLVAIDESRKLNNGEPSGLARWLDALDIAPGDRAVHIGCGVGYYTAIIAEVVGGKGQVTAVELDPDLAARSARNLTHYDHVEVHCADGSTFDPGPSDVIFVNAGATDPQPAWLDALDTNGRLLFPLTVATDQRGIGVGHMLKLVRAGAHFAASFVSPVGVYPCIGARNQEANDLVREAYSAGTTTEPRSLRTDVHTADASCWLHRDAYCLSTREVADLPAPN